MASNDYIKALKKYAQERGLHPETLLTEIEKTLAQTLKKNLGYEDQDNALVRVAVTDEGVKVFCKKQISVYVNNPLLEIGIDDAEKIDKNATIGDKIEVEITPSSRIIFSKFKQAISHKINEIEKENAIKEFENKIGELVVGTINKPDKNFEKEPEQFVNITYKVNFGKVDGELSPDEQIDNEVLENNEIVKFFLLKIKDDPKGKSLVLSRSHPGLIKKLFEFEVPEIKDGTIEIKSIVREAGSRTKMSVMSHDKNIEALGAMIGINGSRCQAVVDELGGERIDIIEYSDDPREYITNALSPAKPISVDIDEENHHAKIIVPKKQLSLAIGKAGQNVRLAARLTTWKMDIFPEE